MFLLEKEMPKFLVVLHGENDVKSDTFLQLVQNTYWKYRISVCETKRHTRKAFYDLIAV